MKYYGTDPVEQPIEKSYSPARGFSMRRRWQGTQAGCSTLANILVLEGYKVDVTYGPTTVLTGELGHDGVSGGVEVPNMFWEVARNTIYRNILDFSTTIDPKNVQVLRSALKNPPLTGDLPPFNLNCTTTQYQAAILAWNRLQYGFGDVPIVEPVLRRSYQISNIYVIQGVLSGVENTIYSTNTIVAQEGVPPAFASAIPYADAGILVPGSFPAGLGMRYGWIKKGPDIATASDNKVQVSQEWHYGLWSQLQYPNVL